MSYHGSNVGNAKHYLGGDSVPPRLVARVLGSSAKDECCPPGAAQRCAPCGPGFGGLGSDAKKAALAAQRDGTAVPLMSTLNIEAAKMLAPLRGVINALPMTSAQKNKLIGDPLDFLFDIFDPIEDIYGRAVDKVIAQKGASQRPFWLLGGSVNIRRVLNSDAKLDPTTRNIVKRLRTMNAFITLMYTQPLEIIGAMLSEGIDIAGAVAKRAGLGSLGAAAVDDSVLFATIAGAVGPGLATVIMTAIGVLVTTETGRFAAGQDLITGENIADREAQARQDVLVQNMLTSQSQPIPKKLGRVGTPNSPLPPPTESSSVPPIVILGGAAAVAFLFLRKKKA